MIADHRFEHVLELVSENFALEHAHQPGWTKLDRNFSRLAIDAFAGRDTDAGGGRSCGSLYGDDALGVSGFANTNLREKRPAMEEIGRASCRERGKTEVWE